MNRCEGCKYSIDIVGIDVPCPDDCNDFDKYEPVAEPCIWGVIEDGHMDERDYATGCGKEFIVESGTPEDNEFRFCPYCGKPIKADSLA